MMRLAPRRSLFLVALLLAAACNRRVPLAGNPDGAAMAQDGAAATPDDAGAGATDLATGGAPQTDAGLWSCNGDTTTSCSVGQWCALPPIPSSVLPSKMWPLGPSDLWVVGRTNQMAHWNGRSWTTSTTTSQGWRGIWGSGANDIWAVGDSGAAAHWDGATWSESNLGMDHDLRTVSGTSANDVWAGGQSKFTTGLYGGATIHWNGSTWSSVDANSDVGALFAVWGDAAADYWAVGGYGVITHWNGTAWSISKDLIHSNAAHEFHGVWGTGANDVWASGNFGIYHWEGAVWSQSRDGATDIWGRSAKDIWAVGGGSIFHWDGAAWSTVCDAIADNLVQVQGSGSNDVWILGQKGTVLRYQQ